MRPGCLWRVNLSAGSRLFHCDEQVLRTNLTGNRTETQHGPLEVCVCVCACVCVCVCVFAEL